MSLAFIVYRLLAPLDLAGLKLDLLIFTNPTAVSLGLFVFVLLRSTTLPPSLFSAGAILFEVSSRNRVLFSSRLRVARLASAYDVRCGVTVCDLLLIESCVFWHSYIDFSPLVT